MNVALQGDPSAYGTSYWSSIVALVLVPFPLWAIKTRHVCFCDNSGKY